VASAANPPAPQQQPLNPFTRGEKDVPIGGGNPKVPLAVTPRGSAGNVPPTPSANPTFRTGGAVGGGAQKAPPETPRPRPTPTGGVGNELPGPTFATPVIDLTGDDISEEDARPSSSEPKQRVEYDGAYKAWLRHIDRTATWEQLGVDIIPVILPPKGLVFSVEAFETKFAELRKKMKEIIKANSQLPK
jgi:hypothetical protein